jgi:pimeloyl-ACP methyl ester carboxylesterase
MMRRIEWSRAMNRASSLHVKRLAAAGGAVLMGATLVAGASQSPANLEPQEITMTSQTIAGPRGRLATFEAGEGAALPVFFLHADSGRAGQWAEMLGRIGKDRRAIAFDSRGSGGSDPAANGDYSYPGRAADIGAVADALGLKRFVIVAASGGGGAALHYAADHADRVAGLLLVDPATDPRVLPPEVRDGFVKDLAGPKSLEVQKAYYASIAGTNPAVRDRILADCDATVPAARAGMGLALATWNPEPTLNAWQGPILILASTANDNAGALYRLRPDVPHQVVAEAGHWLQLDRPDIVEAAIRRFIAGIEQEKN